MKLSAKIIAIITPIIFLGTLSFTALAEEEIVEENFFSDVNEGDYYYIPVKYLYELGIISGYPDNTYRADEVVNRAEALKMIAIACGMNIDDVSPLEIPFIDTPLDAWYTPYLVLAKDSGLIQGYGDGSFKPDQKVNLVESLKMYLECFDNIVYPQGDQFLFADTPEEGWYIPYTSYASSREILFINRDNEIHPDSEMTRGYLAEIIYKQIMFGKGYHFGRATYYGESFDGRGTASGEIFYNSELTAAHRTLPFGTIVETTNLANGKTVQVKINDRGPYGYGRSLDLSQSAFEQIGHLGSGIINIQYKVVVVEQ